MKLKITNQKTIFFGVAAIAAAYAALVLTNYFIRFSITTADAAGLGQFGDYLGGSINGFFAVLSFFALLYVIYLQKSELNATLTELELTRRVHEEQLNSAKAQAEKDAFLDIIQHIAQDLDTLLDQEVSVGISPMRGEQVYKSVRSMLLRRDKQIESLAKNQDAVVIRVIEYFQTLGYYLQQNHFVSMFSEHYYISKYGDYLICLIQYNLLGAYQDLFQKFYDRQKHQRKRFIKRD